MPQPDPAGPAGPPPFQGAIAVTYVRSSRVKHVSRAAWCRQRLDKAKCKRKGRGPADNQIGADGKKRKIADSDFEINGPASAYFMKRDAGGKYAAQYRSIWYKLMTKVAPPTSLCTPLSVKFGTDTACATPRCPPRGFPRCLLSLQQAWESLRTCKSD